MFCLRFHKCTSLRDQKFNTFLRARGGVWSFTCGEEEEVRGGNSYLYIFTLRNDDVLEGNLCLFHLTFGVLFGKTHTFWADGHGLYWD